MPTKIDHDEVVRLRKLGWSQYEIANSFNCCRTTVKRICKNAGLGGRKSKSLRRARTNGCVGYSPTLVRSALRAAESIGVAAASKEFSVNARTLTRWRSIAQVRGITFRPQNLNHTYLDWDR